MNNLTKLFVASLALAALGGISFVLGLGNSMVPGQGWRGADQLMGLGVLLLISGGVLNLCCTLIGAIAIARGKDWDWWYPLNFLATVGALWWGWIAMNL